MNDIVDSAAARVACWRVAQGKEPADLIISGARLVDVHTGEIYPADVAIKGPRIAATGDVSYTMGPRTHVYDATGKFLTPAFIEGHIHATGCQVSLTELAKVLVAHGTTVICTDLYEAAVVGGLEAMRFCLDELNQTPLRTLLTVGYQMYLQNEKFGHTGKISGDDMLACYDWPETVGISEWIYDMVDRNDPYVQLLFQRMLRERRLLVGHAHSYPLPAVQAYACVNGYSDHEAVSADDALEKLRRGYKVMIKQNGAVDFMEPILRLVVERRVNSRYISFSTDHDTPDHLYRRGHLDEQIRIAIRLGVDPVTAIQMASLNNAEYFRVHDDYGSIAPGKMADVCVVDALDETFPVAAVFARGTLVAERYRYTAPLEAPAYPAGWQATMKVGKTVALDDVRIGAPSGLQQVRVRVIGCPHPLFRTETRSAVLPVRDGAVQPDLAHDILKVVVFDRHHGSGRVGKGFVQGVGLRAGAVGASWTPGVEDLTVIGTNDEDIVTAANAIVAAGGGFAAARGGRIIGQVEMPLLGVMAAEPLEVVVEKFERLNAAIAVELQAPREVWRPVAFISMPRAIPSLKICCAGLVEVAPGRAEGVGLFLP
ncbi:MAG: adenine deaminase C-terminal domain-containing protein [Armatimonadota bacterium]|nr:adenine deaminase C-terminal domain-containing protein [Armatimonadota bacterium]